MIFFNNIAKEDDYRRSLMAMVCCEDPSRMMHILPPGNTVSKHEELCKEEPSAMKKDLDYYEKKLNTFPEIKI